MTKLALVVFALALTGCGELDTDLVYRRVRLVATWEDKDRFGGDVASTVEVIASGQRYILDGKYGEPGDEFTMQMSRFRTYKVED